MFGVDLFPPPTPSATEDECLALILLSRAPPQPTQQLIMPRIRTPPPPPRKPANFVHPIAP
ncbi:hypothetical protein CVT25_000442 [Psilocybe cyanescens]|uniref:Uncharacterized protein n=1 Tax=Psilocybe cyanescens TaxID=93625 RepID=A0A409XM76_PSICY|nr:hypothetical protein CVT25_000442 [Psilocybe cyanescens]